MHSAANTARPKAETPISYEEFVKQTGARLLPQGSN